MDTVVYNKWQVPHTIVGQSEDLESRIELG